MAIAGVGGERSGAARLGCVLASLQVARHVRGAGNTDGGLGAADGGVVQASPALSPLPR